MEGSRYEYSCREARVAAAFPDSPANGVLLSVGQQLGSVLQALASGTSDDVGTLGQNVANYLDADGALGGW